MNLNQVTLPSIDVEKAVEFYQTLGLELIVYSAPRYARLICPDEGTSLSVHHVDKLPEGDGIVLYFECEDLDKRVEELKAKGISFYQDPQDERWLWREARLLDPDRNTLCFYHAGENRANPPWKVKKAEL